MILRDKTTTVAYRCPACGRFVRGMVGVFTLSGDLLRLKCDCGGSTLTIAYNKEQKLRITAPCLFCPDPHVFQIGTETFFDRDLLALSCTYSGTDVCFIGREDRVEEAIDEADEALADLLEEAGFDDLPAFLSGRRAVTEGEDNVDKAYRMDYAQIEDVVRFMLVELAEEGGITCGCREGDTARYDFDFQGEDVRVFCRTCGCETRIPMSSTLAANAFLHTDSLTLTKPET